MNVLCRPHCRSFPYLFGHLSWSAASPPFPRPCPAAQWCSQLWPSTFMAVATIGPPQFNLEDCSGLLTVPLTQSSPESLLPAFQRLHLSPHCPRVSMTTVKSPLSSSFVFSRVVFLPQPWLICSPCSAFHDCSPVCACTHVRPLIWLALT